MKKGMMNTVFFILSVFMLIFTSCSNPTGFVQESQLSSNVRSVNAQEWAVGVTYTAGDRVLYYNGEYECIQSHTSYAPGWTPVNAPALWKEIYEGSSNGIVEKWVPGADYGSGDIVFYENNNKYYSSIVTHKAQATWVPPTTYTLYEEVAQPAPAPEFDEARLAITKEYYEKWKAKYVYETGTYEVSNSTHGSSMWYVNRGSFVYYNGPSAWELSDNGIRVYSSTNDEHASTGETNPHKRMTVSEAHGYGMLASVLMDDQYTFSQFVKFYNRFKKSNGTMPWAIRVNEYYSRTPSQYSEFPADDPCTWRPQQEMNTYMLEVASEGSATDGDMDIAYALILAYEKWGSQHYKDLALTILDTLAYDFTHDDYHHIKLGDWATEGETELTKIEQNKKDIEEDPTTPVYVKDENVWENFDYSLVTRTSDFALENLLKFAEFDTANSSKWNSVYNATINAITQAKGSSTGILGDFVFYDTSVNEYRPIPDPITAKNAPYNFHTSVIPGSGIYDDVDIYAGTMVDSNGNTVSIPGNYTFLESPWDGDYYYNACRTPWRISMANIMYSKNDANTTIDQWDSWIDTETSTDPTKVVAGYKLGGEALNDWGAPTYTSPFMVMALASAGENDSWFKAIWEDQMVSPSSYQKFGGKFEDQGYSDYFADTVRLMSAIAASYNK